MYFIDTDMRENLYYVIPAIQKHEHRYVISFAQRYMADQFQRKLLTGVVKCPVTCLKDYSLLKEEEFKGVMLKVYKYVG